jgi:hypothetical protein
MSRKRETGPRHGSGYGPPCPIDPNHGRLIDLPTGKWWCPHSAHKSGETITQSIFTDHEAFGD